MEFLQGKLEDSHHFSVINPKVHQEKLAAYQRKKVTVILNINIEIIQPYRKCSTKTMKRQKAELNLPLFLSISVSKSSGSTNIEPSSCKIAFPFVWNFPINRAFKSSPGLAPDGTAIG